MTPRVYYNEIDLSAAAWLRELMRADLIPAGDVDTRDIRDVAPDDLRGYVSCHFFAGIGGWAYALRLAGWPDDEPVWTGSCPCQPFSAAGKGLGTADERHLWPDWFWLIAQCRPAIVFGEQVASKAGRDWFAVVRADLEGLAYRVGAADLCAAGVGAPHIRQRLWFVAHADDARSQGWRRPELRERAGECTPGASGASRDGVADADCERRTGFDALLRPEAAGWLSSDFSQAARRCEVDRLADPDHALGRSDVAGRDIGDGRVAGRHEGDRDAGECRAALPGTGFWSACDWLPCRDGKWRPAQPGIFPLVDGVSGGRVALGRAVQPPAAALSDAEAAHTFSLTAVFRGAGNAIVPPLAAAFIEAAVAAIGDVEA